MWGHFRYLRFKTFPMTLRTPQGEVFCPLLLNSKHSGVPEDSKSPTLGVWISSSHLAKVGLRHVSCSFLTSYLYPLNCFSCEDVICGTFCFCSFSYSSCGDVIYGTFVVYLATCTTIGIAHTIVGTINGSTLPLMIFCVFAFMFSYSLFTPEHETFPSSTILFLLKAFLAEFVAAFFLFSIVVYIFSLVL
jgi:hypothetical protein